MQKILEMFPLNSNWLYGGKGEPWTGEDISNYMYNPEQGINRSYKGGVDQEINKRFTDYRKETEMSQSSFANHIKISRDVVAAIENMRQNVPHYVIKNLAVYEMLRADWLILGMEPRKFVRKTISEELEEFKTTHE